MRRFLARWPRSVSNFVGCAGLGGHQRGFGIASGDGEPVGARSEESSRTASASGKARHEAFRRGATATRRGIHPTRTQGAVVRLWPVT